jgi:hypothetical protein
MPTALKTFPAITGKNTGEAAKRSDQEMGNCFKPLWQSEQPLRGGKQEIS